MLKLNLNPNSSDQVPNTQRKRPQKRKSTQYYASHQMHQVPEVGSVPPSNSTLKDCKIIINTSCTQSSHHIASRHRCLYCRLEIVSTKVVASASYFLLELCSSALTRLCSAPVLWVSSGGSSIFQSDDKFPLRPPGRFFSFLSRTNPSASVWDFSMAWDICGEGWNVTLFR